MGEFDFLRDLVIIFAVAVSVVTLLHRLKVPPIAGFIVSGILIGPQGFGFIDDIHQVEILAEVGVVLLLFSIGSEFSLQRLKRLWRPILVGGSLQVVTTILGVVVICSLLNMAIRPSILFGFIIALSSTAIVLRGLEEKGELDAPHGRLTIGILLFQDLSVVPMMFILPMLTGSDISIWYFIGALMRALLILSAVLVAARLVVPRTLHIIARTRQRNLFVLTVLLICIGTAWAASISGVSLSLGAFLAGLVVAGSEYRHQALSELIPFREGFTSIFFVSVGMLLDPTSLGMNLPVILLILCGLILGKFIIIFLTGVFMKLPLRVAILAGTALAQVGEFSFVLLRAVQDTEFLNETLMGNLLAAIILSMIITPFILALGPKLAAGVGKIRGLTHMLEIKTAEDAQEEQKKWNDHVIIGGYGLAGRELSKLLKTCNIPYVIADLNMDNIRTAGQKNEPAYFGDITSVEVLLHLGIKQAKELVLVINDPSANARAVEAARRIAPNLHIIVRTRYQQDVEELFEAGANEVIPEEVESTLEITSRICKRHPIDEQFVMNELNTIRDQFHHQPS